MRQVLNTKRQVLKVKERPKQQMAAMREDILARTLHD